jgi:hypothetical protein
MKFVADHMLGTLAKWLRFLGYDTLYPDCIDDGELVRIARDEKRVLLTRDKEIARRKDGKHVKIILIKDKDVEKQVAEVFSYCGIKPDPGMFLSRCSVCNSPIEPVGQGEAGNRVPAGVFERHDRFWKCPGCGRFYWEGTHWTKIKKIAERTAKVAGENVSKNL